MSSIQTKLRDLEKCLRNMKSLLVAYSGGLDSAFLAVVAGQVLGKRMLAVTGRSPSLSDRDWRDAQDVARTFRFKHETISVNEIRDKRYAVNPANRCYYCKSALFTRLQKMAKMRGFDVVADGTNADDLGDYRPGLRAGHEHGIRHPLQECGFTKSDIRLAARQLGLSIADKPASPCLASRFPYGTPITQPQLRAVDLLETKIRRLGFSDCRARIEARGIARIEVPENELKLALDAKLRKAMLVAAHKAGFNYAVLDLAGLRSGNLNQTINKTSPQRHSRPAWARRPKLGQGAELVPARELAEKNYNKNFASSAPLSAVLRTALQAGRAKRAVINGITTP